ncbi:MAG: transcription elongation factor GreA [Anaerolineae bacterium]|nr:transcription elongation factor GreA [Anaerolineae bacterium]
MQDDIVYVTREGLKELEERLDYYRTVRRREVAERLRMALDEGGELVENAEYEDAKNEQAFVEGEVLRLEDLLSKVQIIENNGVRDVVTLGARVTLREEGLDEDEAYMVVGPAEASPSEGKISNKSPMGQALMGHKVGDRVKVQAPDGEFVIVIKDIE